MMENNTIAASEMLVANTYYNSAPAAKVNSIFPPSQIICHFEFSQYIAFMYLFISRYIFCKS